LGVERGHLNLSPEVLLENAVVRIDHRFTSIAADDVGTIRLRESGQGVPNGLCRTAYDAAILCHQIDVDNDDRVNFMSTKKLVSKDTVAESCSVIKSHHYPASKIINSVATGPEVYWSDEAPDDNLDYSILFGSYEEINLRGNITTAFRDGRTAVQTISGACPGS
jgi:hypothetical protein